MEPEEPPIFLNLNGTNHLLRAEYPSCVTFNITLDFALKIPRHYASK